MASTGKKIHERIPSTRVRSLGTQLGAWTKEVAPQRGLTQWGGAEMAGGTSARGGAHIPVEEVVKEVDVSLATSGEPARGGGYQVDFSALSGDGGDGVVMVAEYPKQVLCVVGRRGWSPLKTVS